MSRRGQVLVVAMWVLALLALLAVSLAHQTSQGLKLARFQEEKLRAYGFARAGVVWAMSRLLAPLESRGAKDKPWQDDAQEFRAIRLDGVKDGTAMVNYVVSDGLGERVVDGIEDEQRKININTAPVELLRALLEGAGGGAVELAGNIVAWRGGAAGDLPNYDAEGYPNKGSEFMAPEELILVKGMQQDIYDRLRDSITVWGDGQVNINTATRSVLEALITYGRQTAPPGSNGAEDLAMRIASVRPVDSLAALREQLNEHGGLSTDEVNVLNALAGLMTVRSSYFRIRSTGLARAGGVAVVLECVIDRDNQQVVFVHER